MVLWQCNSRKAVTYFFALDDQIICSHALKCSGQISLLYWCSPTRLVMHSLPLEKLCCLKSPHCLMCALTWLSGGSVSQGTEVRLTGLQLIGLSFLPSHFKMGAMLPFIQTPGTLPDHHDFSNMTECGLAIISPSSLWTLGCIFRWENEEQLLHLQQLFSRL